MTEKEQQELMRRFTAQQQSRVEIDPALVEQMKNFLALHGAGTVGQQIQAQTRQGCATLTTAALFFGGLIGLIGLFALICTIGAGVSSSNYQEVGSSRVEATVTPSPTVRVLRAIPVDR